MSDMGAQTNQSPSKEDSGLVLASVDDEQTLHEETNPYKSHKVTVDDWSGSGRGSHVDFEKQETISLKQGKPDLEY